MLSVDRAPRHGFEFKMVAFGRQIGRRSRTSHTSELPTPSLHWNENVRTQMFESAFELSCLDWKGCISAVMRTFEEHVRISG